MKKIFLNDKDVNDLYYILEKIENETLTSIFDEDEKKLAKKLSEFLEDIDMIEIKEDNPF